MSSIFVKLSKFCVARAFLIPSLLCLTLGLTACEHEDKYSYKYLMTHPWELQKYYNGCVQEVVPSTLPCNIINQAEADFTILSTRREQDPEKFGAEILQVQTNAVYLRTQLDDLLAAYRKLGKEKAGLEAIKAKRIEIDKMQAAYQLSIDKLQILLVVIAATSRV